MEQIPRWRWVAVSACAAAGWLLLAHHQAEALEDEVYDLQSELEITSARADELQQEVEGLESKLQEQSFTLDTLRYEADL